MMSESESTNREELPPITREKLHKHALVIYCLLDTLSAMGPSSVKDEVAELTEMAWTRARDLTNWLDSLNASRIDLYDGAGDE